MMLIIANLLPSSYVSYVKEIKPKYSKLTVIIALTVGKIERIPMYNLIFVFEFISSTSQKAILNFKFVSDVCDPYLA
jgi:hypothetical protein